MLEEASCVNRIMDLVRSSRVCIQGMIRGCRLAIVEDESKAKGGIYAHSHVPK